MVAIIAAVVGFVKYRQRPIGVLSWIVLCAINITGLIRHHDSWWLIVPVTAGCALWPVAVAWETWRRRRTNTA
jgi:hypothetical protein